VARAEWEFKCGGKSARAYATILESYTERKRERERERKREREREREGERERATLLRMEILKCAGRRDE
jgi:hypothetical protein